MAWIFFSLFSQVNKNAWGLNFVNLWGSGSLHWGLTGCGATERTWIDTKWLRRWIVVKLALLFPTVTQTSWSWICKAFFKREPTSLCFEDQIYDSGRLKVKIEGVLSGTERSTWSHQTKWLTLALCVRTLNMIPHWLHCCWWLTAVWSYAQAKFNWTFCRRFCGFVLCSPSVYQRETPPQRNWC